MEPQRGDLIAGRYRLEHELGKGGMGSVWAAHHVQLDAPVAVKFMAPAVAATAQGRARFEREAKAAAGLPSPHVVKIHDYGVEADTPFMVMELLEGETLDALLRRERRLSLAAAGAILVPIAKALAVLHERGIVHRDLKPANVFLARAGDEAVVKILDFGIAKQLFEDGGGEHTESGVLLGSPHHMSPEQARGAEIDARSDLWSLGVVLFRVLTGVRPFDGTNVGDTIARIIADAIPRASDLAPHLPPEIDRFFERALSRAREGRFATVRDMLDGYDQVLRAAGESALNLAVVAAAPSTVRARDADTAVVGAGRLERGAEDRHDARADATTVAGTSRIVPVIDDTRVPSTKVWRRGALLLGGAALAAAIAAFALRAAPDGTQAAAVDSGSQTPAVEAASAPEVVVPPPLPAPSAAPPVPASSSATAATSAGVSRAPRPRTPRPVPPTPSASAPPPAPAPNGNIFFD
jgi:serine/threonine-protein kinase